VGWIGNMGSIRIIVVVVVVVVKFPYLFCCYSLVFIPIHMQWVFSYTCWWLSETKLASSSSFL